MKTILVQIYRFRPEKELLKMMAAAFLRQGFQMVLWSNRDQATDMLMVPLTQGPTDDIYLDLEEADAKGWTRFDEWSAFSSYLGKHYGAFDPAYDLDRCYRVSRTIFNRLQPSLYLCWCGMNPIFAIPKEVAREHGVPVLVWEAGMLSDTILLDCGGVAVDSVWCGKDLPNLDKKDIDRAKDYLSTWRNTEIDMAVRCGSTPGGRKLPRVLILGCMDIAAGVHRVQGGGPRTLPGYLDGIELALVVASCHDGVTVYRPHPREPVGPLSRLKGSDIIIDTDSALNTSIVWADVVIGYGSKADYIALTLRKPFIFAGIGFLSGKGCTYEALTKDEMSGVLKTAVVDGTTAEQVRSYEKITAWMLSQGCYNIGTAGPCRQGIPEFVTHALMYASSVETSGTVEDVLSPIGRKWLECAHGSTTPCEEPSVTMVGSDPLKAVLDCFDNEANYAVLDFDHTLLLGNSTELFIATARPRLLAELIDMGIEQLGRRRLTPFSDRVRVLAIALLMPWTITLWKRSAARIVDERWNQPLWELVQKKADTTVVIASNGFRALIKPLVHAAIGPYNAVIPIIASDLRPRGRDIRTEGKLIATQRDVPEISWEQAIVVTDSLEDRELLTAAKYGVLTRWVEPSFRSEPGYFPLRYVSRGKYPGQNYVKKLIFGQDLVVWLILFASTYMNLCSLMFLFISFYIVYEIGYYENDFKASILETNPTLSGDHEHYKKYAIVREGWVWSILLGLVGCIIAERPNLNIFTAFSGWIGILISVRFCFFKYNRKLPEKRLLYYLILQVFKNFAGVVVLLPTLTGLLLAASHLFQHSTIYMVYRCGGDKDLFPRALCRLTLFIMGVGVVYGAGFSLPLTDLMIAVTWSLYQAIIEQSGEHLRITRVVTHVYMGLHCRLKSMFCSTHSA